MTEITSENINNLICDDITQHFEKLKSRKVRSEKQKLNDLKLKDRLSEYHLKKKEAKEELVRMKEINEKLNELIKEEEINIKQDEADIRQLVKEEYPNGYCIDKNVAINITKARKGRPKKIKQEYPAADVDVYPGPDVAMAEL